MTPTGHPVTEAGSDDNVEHGPHHVVSDLDHFCGRLLGGFRPFDRNHSLNNAFTLGRGIDEAFGRRPSLRLGVQHAGDGGIESNIHTRRLAGGPGMGELNAFPG